LKPGRNVTDLDDVARNPQNDFVEITDLKGLESIRRKLDFKRPIRARIGESKKIEREIAIPARLSLAGERPFKRRWIEYVILLVDIDGRSIRTTVESG
jgi:hypothetical protein